jgi:hypothetical protein
MGCWLREEARPTGAYGSGIRRRPRLSTASTRDRRCAMVHGTHSLAQLACAHHGALSPPHRCAMVECRSLIASNCL